MAESESVSTQMSLESCMGIYWEHMIHWFKQVVNDKVFESNVFVKVEF